MDPPKSDSMAILPGLVGVLPSSLPMVAPQQVMISGCRKDCIRLRGLPYEAQVQHVLEFLGEYSKHIVFQGVHMVYNAQVWKPANVHVS